MDRLLTTLALIAIAATLVSCSPSEPEQAYDEPAPPPEEEEAVVDPTVVDPSHYMMEFENDRVRVLRITYGPGEESPMHFHPDSVAVFLTDHNVEFTGPDGETVKMELGAGQQVFSPAGNHAPKNTAAEVLEVVLVELKSAPTGVAAGDDAADPTVVDAKHYTTEFENDRVRVLRIQYGPGEASVMHYHPDSVAVFLTPHDVEFEAPDGTKQQVRAEAGEVMFAPAENHLPTNIGEEAFEVVLVELK